MIYVRQFNTRDASFVNGWSKMDDKILKLLSYLKLKKLNDKYYIPYGNYMCQDYISILDGVGITIGEK
jgi:hypothetical protein